MYFIHHYRIMQNSLSALNIPFFSCFTQVERFPKVSILSCSSSHSILPLRGSFPSSHFQGPLPSRHLSQLNPCTHSSTWTPEANPLCTPPPAPDHLFLLMTSHPPSHLVTLESTLTLPSLPFEAEALRGRGRAPSDRLESCSR